MGVPAFLCLYVQISYFLGIKPGLDNEIDIEPGEIKKPLYVKFFHCNYYSQNDALASVSD